MPGGGGGHRALRLMSKGAQGQGTLYSEGQCINGNGHMGTPQPPLSRLMQVKNTPPPSEQIDANENIIFPQHCFRGVKPHEYLKSGI